MKRGILVFFALLLIAVSGCLGSSPSTDPQLYQYRYGQAPPPQTPKPVISPEIEMLVEQSNRDTKNLMYLVVGMGAVWFYLNRERVFDRYKEGRKLPAKTGRPLILRREGLYEITHRENISDGMMALTLDDGFEILPHQVYGPSDLIPLSHTNLIGNRHMIFMDRRWFELMLEGMGVKLSFESLAQLRLGGNMNNMHEMFARIDALEDEKESKETMRGALEDKAKREVEFITTQIAKLKKAEEQGKRGGA